MRGAAIDEARGQPLVQRVRQPVLDLAGAALPVRRRRAASRRGRRYRSRRARRRAAASACRCRRRCGRARRSGRPTQSVGSRRSRTTWRNTRAHSRTWLSSAILRKSGIWQASHSSRTRRAAAREVADLRLARQRRQRLQVGGVVAAHQAGPRRRRGQAAEQRVDMGEIEVAVAPAELLQRLEAVGFDRRDDRPSQRRAVGGGAEGAVAHAAAGAAGDLRHLGRVSAGAADGRRTCPARRRRHGPRPCSGPCRSRRSRPGNRPPCPGTAPPGRCGCAGESRPITTAQPPRRRRISSAMA